ncbi:ABC-F family ATP-binding cassette domain-containing protein [Nannocystis bainbridge]|uniref:ABC-F family ATP-binding cassette domain-containing protein n=1 Tax=Nannocystis bainbridge TaxID=2995303 RepID=A0ABT5E0P7_9BACT|nr:ABC-F family ATP-binding cassette domain-containing protein [Nannocystis bainbridge]MDC0719400.1 ABC-F family ATP-binding cassette domain-containing protein [Nannocystis bainbridge]
MPIASLRQVEKSYGVRRVLAGVNLTLMTGERVGLVGNNGSGKTTLARILAGLDAPDAGEVVLRRDAAIAYLEQEPRLPPGLTALEAVLSGLGQWSAARARYDAATARLEQASDAAAVDVLVTEQAAAAAEIERCGGWSRAAEAESYLARLGVRDPTALTDRLSGGERRRVALATLLARQPDLAVLDEPTNHLDVSAIEWLERHLAENYVGTVLLITHDRYILDRVCTRTFEVDRGSVYAYDGGFGAYLEAKAERMAHAQRTEANRQNFLRRELEWLRRQPKARTTKQTARVNRAEAELAKSGPPRDRRVELSLEAARSGKTILELRGVTLELSRVLVRDFTLALNQGERIGVVGPNGSGKTTLLRSIVGDLLPSAGEVVRGKHTAVAYLDQNRSGLDDDRTVYDNIAERRRGLDLGGGHPLDIARYLERFLFDTSTYAQKVGSLSGGERARVALAVLLSGASNLVLLDEPTNDLDVATLGAVEEMLLEFTGAAIIVTHDRWFLDRVATSILAFEGDGKVVRHHGNYSDYLERLAEIEAAPEPQPTARPAPAKVAAPVAKRGLSSSEKRELQGLLGKIEAAEGEVGELEAKLGDPAVYGTGKDQVAELVRQLDAARQRAAALVTRWEDLEQRSADAGA